MSTLRTPLPTGRRLRGVATLMVVATLSACSVLTPKATAPPAFYALDDTLAASARPTAASTPVGTQTLIVNPVRADSGFDSQRIIYLREPHKLEYFARSEWVDTPARMLGPLLVAALSQNGGFQAVVMASGSASADLRLDTEIVRLQQEFFNSPSSVRVTLRAYLVDEKTRRVVAWKEFDQRVDAGAENAQAGVVAANRAVHAVLGELAQFVQLIRKPLAPNSPIRPTTIR